ncbi:phospholipase B1, membrane-associated-like isoform X2 [Entelurus aequoreus]|uniref:phospholipase B1, membrane-associated-like isoform X2 n=1 Tax=Entelurus aequoreus TaxID=161455 RepID=UPI002B1DEA1F|nr:phospholipase B1, membrane-associated-like isoform X2 [Entelurus aequoreus]
MRAALCACFLSLMCVSAVTIGTEMHCEDGGPSDHTPTSVHELRPGDIQVVAAVGDYLTVENGMSLNQDPYDSMIKHRGLSWSIGGDGNLTTVTTLPNILKQFNPNLTGFSVGMRKDNTHQIYQRLTSWFLLRQMRSLVDRMKKDSAINFELDWKVITVLIGASDICEHCYQASLFSSLVYKDNVQRSLDYLHKEVPRALVNLIEPVSRTPVSELNLDTLLECPTRLVKAQCPCVVLPTTNLIALHEKEELNRKYQLVLRKLVESKRYDTRPDFTVVIQPFFRKFTIPRLPDGRPDHSFFTDCLYLSQKAQTQMARALWNNMLEMPGKKTIIQDLSTDIELKCPSKTSPFVFISVNSGPPPPVMTATLRPPTTTTNTTLTSISTTNSPTTTTNTTLTSISTTDSPTTTTNTTLTSISTTDSPTTTTNTTLTSISTTDSPTTTTNTTLTYIRTTDSPTTTTKTTLTSISITDSPTTTTKTTLTSISTTDSPTTTTNTTLTFISTTDSPTTTTNTTLTSISTTDSPTTTTNTTLTSISTTDSPTTTTNTTLTSISTTDSPTTTTKTTLTSISTTDSPTTTTNTTLTYISTTDSPTKTTNTTLTSISTTDSPTTTTNTTLTSISTTDPPTTTTNTMLTSISITYHNSTTQTVFIPTHQLGWVAVTVGLLVFVVCICIIAFIFCFVRNKKHKREYTVEMKNTKTVA